MAASRRATFPKKFRERQLECSICCNRFTEPKFLDCLHTFCLKCLHHLELGKNPQILKIKCPLCGRNTMLESSTLEDLPTNVTLSALVEEFAILEQLLQGQGSEIKCQNCNNENPADSFCMDCAHFLCQDCRKAHGRQKRSKSHKTYTMAQLQSGEIAYKSKLREEPKCQQHPDQSRNIYCETCEQLACTTCSVLKHEKHLRADVSEALKTCQQEITEFLKNTEKKKTELKNATTKTAESRKKLDTMFEATNRKISQKADKEVARIREREQKLKQEAKEIYQDRVKTLETAEDAINTELTAAEQTQDMMKQLLAQEIKTEILHLKQKFLRSLREFVEQQQIVPEKVHFMAFQECGETEKTLGRLILNDEWKLKQTKTEGVINSVAVFSDNEIVTVDGGYEQLITYLPKTNPQTPFISQMPHITDIKDPVKVVVNRLDHLIVLDGPAVKTFSREYQLLHQFQPEIDSDSQPTCLAVDEDNLIAVGYMAKEMISLHNPDGTLIRKLTAPMIEDQLVLSNKRIVYTNCDMCKLVSKDYNGGMAFTKDIKSPLSVCCDGQGNIYVAKGLDSWQSESNIHVFGSDGRHNGCVIAHSMPPEGMMFMPAGDLLLGGKDFLHVYQRV